MIIQAFAKINPFLKITGTRQDGYHDLELIFLPISLCDILSAERNDADQLRLTCDDPSIPIENNLITKAYRMIKADHPGLCGLDISLTKHIPSGAGLGGGSADAAAFLKLLSPLCGLRLSGRQLLSYAARLGADVPALFMGEPSLGRGIGELLTLLESRLSAHLLIVSPGFSCSTKEMYSRFDGRTDLLQPEHSDVMCKALEEGDLETFCSGLFNVFEQLLEPEKKLEVDRLKAAMVARGAKAALMTGSGSCVFGVFETEAQRDQAACSLEKDYRVYKASLPDSKMLLKY